MIRAQVRLSYMTFAILLEELLAGPGTAMSLAEQTGMGYQYMRKLMAYLHKKKLVHVASWDRDSANRYSIRVWALGPGRDAKKPPAKTRSAISRDYRTKTAGAVLAGTPFAGLMA